MVYTYSRDCWSSLSFAVITQDWFIGFGRELDFSAKGLKKQKKQKNYNHL